MIKFACKSKRLLLLFVGLNLFCMKRTPPRIGGERSERKKTRTSEFTFSQVRLDRNAITDGYGYKTSNLMELKNVVKNLAGQLPDGYQVAVPSFVGITSNQIQDFFEKNGLNIQDSWNAMIMSINTENPLEWLKDPENRKNFIESSNQLADEIENLEIKSTYFLDIESVNLFLNNAQIGDWRLMVRSTGKEDTKELPNAGGNYSEPNVYPDKVSVINAIKKVVASYFKEKSLSQRIDAGDKEIFADPLTPVLLQIMIGEGINGAQELREIPVGCVVYTGEVEGSTPGVVTIQAAFGHNEGVVNSEVAVDTYYVKNKNIRPVLQIKSQRIIPVEGEDGYGLSLVNNPATIKNIHVLSDEDILAIDHVARAVHDCYNEAMDIELVFEPKTKTIYLVQARPLQIQNKIEASYIADIKNIPPKNVLKCSTVSAAGGSVRRITNKNQIIIASTLQQALDIYLSPGIDQMQVSCAIVQGQAEPTSHAAAIFRGAGKAILTCDETEKLEKWLDEENVNLFIDVQQEVVVNAKDLMDVDDFIKVGWFKHPISQRLSITLAPYAESGFTKLLTITDRKKLIEIMKTGSNVIATRALKTLLSKISNILKAGQDLEDPSILQGRAFNELQKIYNVVVKLADEMVKNEIFKKDPQDIERLYAINFFEAILFQQKETSKYVNVFSVKSVFDDYEKNYKFKKDKLRPLLGEQSSVITKNLSALHFAQAGCDELYTDEIQNKWINFVYGVFNSDQTNQEKFIKLLIEIEKMEVLPAWINISFSRAVFESDDAVKILNNLVGEYQEAEYILEILKQKKEQLESYNILRWDGASKFQSNLQHFEKNFLDYYMSDEFFELFEAAKESQLAVIILTSLMDKFVDTFDKSIKTLKASTKYKSDEDKVKDFKIIVGKYWNLFEDWTKFIPNDSIIFKETLGYYLKVLSNNSKNELTDLDLRQLNPSKSFSLTAEMIGSEAREERILPQTLEDLFMLIHQNLLIINGMIFKKYCSYFVVKTNDLFKKIQNELLRVRRLDCNPILTALYFSTDSIVFHYNLHLRAHSVSFDLSMNKDGTVSIKYNFVGKGRERWIYLLGAEYFFSFFNNTKFNYGHYSTQHSAFKITYDNNSLNLNKLKDEIEFLIEITIIEFSLYFSNAIKFANSNFNLSEQNIIDKMTNLFSGLYINKQSQSEDKLAINSLLVLMMKGSKYENIGTEFLKTIFKNGSEQLKETVLGYDGAVLQCDNSAKIFILNKIIKSGSNTLKQLALKSKGLVYKILESKDSKAIKTSMSILRQVFTGTNNDLKKKVLSRHGIIRLLIKSKIEMPFVFDVLDSVFSSDNDELKKVALKQFGVINALLFSPVEVDNDFAMKILNNIFKLGSDDFKVKILKIQDFVSNIVTSRNSNDIENIESILNFLRRVFSGNSENLKIKMLGSYLSPFYFLIKSKYEPFINEVAKIIRAIFESGSDKLKRAALNPLERLIEYSGSQEVLELTHFVLNYIFEKGSDELKESSLSVFNAMINKYPISHVEIDLAEKFFNNVFKPGSKKLKKEFFSRKIIKFIESGDQKAINITKDFFRDVIDNGSENAKKDLFKVNGPIYYLMEDGSDRVLEFVVDILNYIFSGSDDELKSMVLSGYYTIPNLIETDHETVLNAMTIIFSNILEGDSEKLKAVVRKKFSQYIKANSII